MSRSGSLGPAFAFGFGIALVAGLPPIHTAGACVFIGIVARALRYLASSASLAPPT